VITVRRIMTILGILIIIITILISGSAVASTYHAVDQENLYCTNADDAVGGENDTWATLGRNSGPPYLGIINLTMGEHPIPADKVFTIFGAINLTGNINETYG
jgi:hypothetical protein